MPCLITTKSALKRVRGKTTTKKQKNKIFTTKTQYLNLKAPSNNFKTQSDKKLPEQNLLSPNYTVDRIFPQ